MHRFSAVSAGLFFILGIIVLLVVFDLVKGGTGLRKGYDVKARFNGVHELKVGDPVKQAGVEVGMVKSVGIVGTNVDVTLRISRAVQIHQDAVAAVKSIGLFGQNFVGLTFGSTGKLEPGTYIKTEERPDFDQLVMRIDSVASGFEGLNTTISEAVKSFTGGEAAESPLGFIKDFVSENKGNISNMFANLSDVTLKLKSGEGTLGRLISDDTLYTKLSQTGDNVNELVASIRKGEGSLGKLMTDEALYRETTGAMTDLHQILGKINRGEGTIGNLVNDASLIKNMKMTMQKLDKASEGIEDQGPLSIIGIAAGALF